MVEAAWTGVLAPVRPKRLVLVRPVGTNFDFDEP